MPCFAYYLPGATGFADAKRALSHAIDPAHAHVREAIKGPDGMRGAYFADVSAGATLDPERYSWEKAPGNEWWIGTPNSGPLPGPDDLDRGVRLPGATLLLGDGRAWRVPTALLPGPGGARGESPLPKVRKLRDDGTVERVVEARWRDLYLAADQVWDLFAKATPIDEARETEIAVLAIAAQYRVSLVEVSALGLLTDQAMGAIFATLVAYPNWPGVLERAGLAGEV